jgi:hypothetical protein
MNFLLSLRLIIFSLALRLLLYDVFVDEFWVVDEKPCHFLFEKLYAADVVIVLISKRRFI